MTAFFLVGFEAAGQETREYFYDRTGQVIGVVTPDGTAIVYEYDSAGNRLRRSVTPSSSNSVTAILPSSAPPSFAGAANILGKGLANATAVTFSDAGINATISGSPSDTSIALALNVGAAVAPGNYGFTVQRSSGGPIGSGAVLLNVPAAPLLQSLSPASVSNGQVVEGWTLAGLRLGGASRILFDMAGLSATGIAALADGSSVSARLKVASNVPSSVVGVRVVTPNGTSNSVGLNVTHSAAIWVTQADGLWSEPSNWSNNSLPQSGDEVSIPVSGITVTHSTGSDTVLSVLSAAALVLSGGSLTVSSTLQANAAFTLSGGILSSATVNAVHGVTVVGASSTLSGVTINGDVDLPGVSGYNPLFVGGGLTVVGTVHLGVDNAPCDKAYMQFNGTQTVAGAAMFQIASRPSCFGSQTVAGLYVPQGSTLTIAPGVTIRGGNGFVGNYPGYPAGAFTNQGRISADVAGEVMGIYGTSWANSGTIEAKNGGSLFLAGAFTNAGILSPGTAPGFAALSGTYVQDAGGTLNIDLGGLTAGTSYGRLQVTGEATFAGTLKLNLINGFSPSIGDSFDVATYASRSGTFTTVTGSPGPGKKYQATYGPTALTVSVVSDP